MRRNLILSTAHRLRSSAVEPFFQSLRQSGYSGDLVIFCSAVDRESIGQMKSWGAQVVPFHFSGKHVGNRAARFWWLWKKAFASGISEQNKERLAHKVFHLFYRRHLLYLDFLRARTAVYDKVFLTDCRDVFFQSDPFAWEQAPGLHFFLEEEANKLGVCSHHIRWITSQFGSAMLEEWADETVSCAGTVFGDLSGMLDYLTAMVTQTMAVNSLRAADGDQGVHNYLLLADRFPKSTLHANRQGPIMTLGPVDVANLNFDERGRVLNDAGSIVPVLHQYDRDPSLRATVLGQLDPPNAREAIS